MESVTLDKPLELDCIQGTALDLSGEMLFDTFPFQFRQNMFAEIKLNSASAGIKRPGAPRNGQSPAHVLDDCYRPDACRIYLGLTGIRRNRYVQCLAFQIIEN
jgi:hypothetical protein